MKKACGIIIALILLMSALFPIGVTATTPNVTLPMGLTPDTNNSSYTCSDNSTVYYYIGVKKSNFDSYIATLEDEGYDTVQTYDADGSYYALMDNGTATIFVSFLKGIHGGNTGRMRVFVDTSGTPYHTQKTEQSADVCSVKLWQLDVDNSYNGGDDGGMSYVIRFSDGTFAIIDGGYRTETEVNNLYSILTDNNVLGGKPIITAWFFTHVHIDHYGILKQFRTTYKDSVEVRGFYYNFPGVNIDDIWPNNANGAQGDMRRFTDVTLYSKLHSGMVLGFAGATVEVLATHEDISQSYYNSNGRLTENLLTDGNDTSTVLRFNFGEQSVMFLADGYSGVSNALTGTYTKSYLKSDFMQLAHHGFDDGGSEDLYNAIDADVLLWPMDIVRYTGGNWIKGRVGDTKTVLHYYDNSKQKTAYDNAKDVFPAYRNSEFEFPYTVQNNNPRDNTVSYFTALAEKKLVCISSGHDFVGEFSDASHHWQECSRCGQMGNKILHTGGEATCAEKAKCDDCSAPYGKLLEHNFAITESDADAHWKVCAVCDAVDTKEAHAFDANSICACGYKQETSEETSNASDETTNVSDEATTDNVAAAEEKQGCFSTIVGGTPMLLVTLGACTVFARKKKKADK